MAGSAGCQRAPAETTAIARGQSSFAFASRPSAKATVAEEPQSGDYLKPTHPIGRLAQPTYPQALLDRRDVHPAVLGVRLHVDEKGQVTEVEPSLMALSIPGPHDAEFMSAIRDCVREWRFQPAQFYHVDVVRNATGEYDYHASNWRNTDTWLDLTFTFTAIGAARIGAVDKPR